MEKRIIKDVLKEYGISWEQYIVLQRSRDEGSMPMHFEELSWYDYKDMIWAPLYNKHYLERYESTSGPVSIVISYFGKRLLEDIEDEIQTRKSSEQEVTQKESSEQEETQKKLSRNQVAVLLTYLILETNRTQSGVDAEISNYSELARLANALTGYPVKKMQAFISDFYQNMNGENLGQQCINDAKEVAVYIKNLSPSLYRRIMNDVKVWQAKADEYRYDNYKR